MKTFRLFILPILLPLLFNLKAYNEKELKVALSTKTCENCNLVGINMKDGNLSLSGIHGTNLDKANFSYSNLNGCDFRGLNLSESNLQYSSMNGMYLSRANLEKADMRYAQAKGSDFCKTNLKDASLQNTDFSGSIFLDIKNLETAHCNEKTKLPIGYDCVNGKVKIVDCSEKRKLPIGYYCKEGIVKPLLLPIEGCPDEILNDPSPQEYYNYFEGLKNKVLQKEE